MPGKQVSKANRERIIGAYITETGSTEPKQRPGRPKTLKKRDTRALKRIIRTDRFSPLGDVTDKFNTSLDTTFHYNTVRRYLHDEGLGSYTAKKKPRLTEKHRTDRLKWCKDKKNWAEEWKQMVWSDESRFALFQSDGRARVWRSPRETYNKDCIQSTDKFGGGSVMFWGVSVGMGLDL
ncbi:unnamed protein product [Rhizophagus irregularis]|nr:unnamed protein product [Rhizophagus irregularis]